MFFQLENLNVKEINKIIPKIHIKIFDSPFKEHLNNSSY